jgi:hypothetical protein
LALPTDFATSRSIGEPHQRTGRIGRPRWLPTDRIGQDGWRHQPIDIECPESVGGANGKGEDDAYARPRDRATARPREARMAATAQRRDDGTRRAGDP